MMFKINRFNLSRDVCSSLLDISFWLKHQKVWFSWTQKKYEFITGVIAVQSKFIFFVHFLNDSLHVDENEEFLKNGSTARLLIESKGHALHAFVNEVLHGCNFHPPPALLCKFVNTIKKFDYYLCKCCHWSALSEVS